MIEYVVVPRSQPAVLVAAAEVPVRVVVTPVTPWMERWRFEAVRVGGKSQLVERSQRAAAGESKGL